MFDGTITKRKDGRVELKITIGSDNYGKRIRKSFYGKSEREVKKKRDEWAKRGSIAEQAEINNDTLPFSVWADKWLTIYKKGNVREYTYENTYNTRVQKYLIPYFGKRPMRAITPIDVQEFFNMYKNLSIDLLKTLKIILNDMFNKAIDNDICNKNPVVNTRLQSTYKKKEKKTLNLKQREKAIKWAIKNGYIDILTVLKTGIRRGELLGLRWCDIDLENKTIIINQSISPPAKKGCNIDYELKSKSSHRQIPIDQELTDCLKLLPRDSELVFQCSNANAYGKRVKSVLMKMSEECGLPYLTLHELRHTYGTVLREKGVDIYSISKLMGHSSIEVTAQRYVHNDLDVLRKAIEV